MERKTQRETLEKLIADNKNLLERLIKDRDDEIKKIVEKSELDIREINNYIVKFEGEKNEIERKERHKSNLERYHEKIQDFIEKLVNEGDSIDLFQELLGYYGMQLSIKDNWDNIQVSDDTSDSEEDGCEDVDTDFLRFFISGLKGLRKIK